MSKEPIDEAAVLFALRDYQRAERKLNTVVKRVYPKGTPVSVKARGERRVMGTVASRLGGTTHGLAVRIEPNDLAKFPPWRRLSRHGDWIPGEAFVAVNYDEVAICLAEKTE